MEDRIADLLSFCSEIDFGAVSLSDGERKFWIELNQDLLSLCRDLPESTHTDATILLMSLNGGFSFIKCFYVPAWSILFWLNRSCPCSKKLDSREMGDAKTGHAMAMLLHALDDHLTDHQEEVTHLALLLRSHFWMIMNQAFNRLAEGLDTGMEIIRSFIDEYYLSIRNRDHLSSLDSYCDLFRKQMATWVIVPTLMMRKMTRDEEFHNAVRSAYCSFGIAWRLLDDIQDIQKDMMEGVHSSIYVCLSDELRNHWNGKKIKKNDDCARAILSYIIDNKMLNRITERICRELESAACTLDHFNMGGLADELRSLSKPLTHGQKGFLFSEPETLGRKERSLQHEHHWGRMGQSLPWTGKRS